MRKETKVSNELDIEVDENFDVEDAERKNRQLFRSFVIGVIIIVIFVALYIFANSVLVLQ